MKMKMKILLMACLAAAMAACETSPRGMETNENGFRMTVPGTVRMHQGDVESINIALARGSMFKQDVRLNIQTTPGIKVDPANETIKASEGPDATIKLTAAKDAPLGDYRVTVTGTPDSGAPATTEFLVRVSQP